MRRRLRKFFPIVLIALAVQVLAPIAACWAAGIAASDPLQAAVICHDNAASSSGPADPNGQPPAHDGCCSVCSVAHGGAPLDTPQRAVATPYGAATRVVWLDRAADPAISRTGSHAQARAPPLMT
ncbi:MAG: DUF2946 domain-containing protein [Bradyrhizobium sp.]